MSKCWSCGACQECAQKEKCICADQKKLYGANAMRFGKYKGMTIHDVREEDPSLEIMYGIGVHCGHMSVMSVMIY